MNNVPSYKDRPNGQYPPGAPQQPPQPVGMIQIVLLEDGSIHCNLQGAATARPTFNMMFETAKQNALSEILRAEKQKVVLPPPIDASALRT